MLSAQAPAAAPAEGPALAPEPCAGRTFLPGLALPPGRASFPLCPSVRQGQRMLCHATCFPRALRNTVCSENALGKLGEGACGSEDARRARSRPERAGPTRHLLAASREGRAAGGGRHAASSGCPRLRHRARDHVVVPECAHEACVDSRGRPTPRFQQHLGSRGPGRRPPNASLPFARKERWGLPGDNLSELMPRGAGTWEQSHAGPACGGQAGCSLQALGRPSQQHQQQPPRYHDNHAGRLSFCPPGEDGPSTDEAHGLAAQS